jgi:hypothetical protein
MAKNSTKTAQESERASRFQRVRTRALANAPHRSTAPFGVTADGVMLVNIDALDSVDIAELKNRKVFIGVELPARERTLARRMLGEIGHELGARIAGALAPRRAAKRPGEAG